MNSNLPPGVSVNMIPGNRPEDEAEEAFWDMLAGCMNVETDAKACRLYDQVVNDDDLSAVVLGARDLGYTAGYEEGRADEQLAQAAKEADKDRESGPNPVEGG